MAAPDIILVTGKGHLSRFDQKLQKWFQVVPVQSDPENATPVRLLILQNNGFSLKAVHDTNGSVVLLCSFVDTVISTQSQAVLHITLKDGNKYCMQFSNPEEGATFQMILKSAFEESRRKPNGKPYSGGTKLGGALAAVSPPPAKNFEGPRSRSPRMAANMGTNGDSISMLIDTLKKALASGDVSNAKEVAGTLAQLKVKTNMIVESVGDIPPGRPGTIRLNVCIEDRVQSGGKVILTVRPNESIATLKRKMFQEYRFPIQVQRWIMGRRIPKDAETLLENGIGISGATVYLYLVSAEKLGITKQQAELERQTLNQPPQGAQQYHVPGGHSYQGGAGGGGPASHEYRGAAGGPISRSRSPGLISDNRELFGQPPPHANYSPQQPPSYSHQTLPTRTRVPSGGDSGYATQAPRRTPPPPQRREPPKQKIPTAEQVGWHCPICTLINPPSFPGCRVCCHDRPADYHIPPVGSYIMDPDEKKRHEDVMRNEQLMQQLETNWEQEARETRAANFQRILEVEGHDLIPNTEPFDCLICYIDVEVGEGVVLRDCLHSFCKDCLGEHIRQCTEPVVMCPYQDGQYSCPEPIQEREIRGLVTIEQFQKHLRRGLVQAEAQAANSFHCKTTDCAGFCFFDDDNNFFDCPICAKRNCLTCKAIHEGMNCKEYQEDLKRRANNDVAARQTQEALETMVRDGEAMECPKCGIIVMKKDGCDWIRCTMCRVEICWVTRGFRWGPAGSGDTSGGCQCRVNRKKCHPNCANCH